MAARLQRTRRPRPWRLRLRAAARTVAVSAARGLGGTAALMPGVRTGCGSAPGTAVRLSLPAGIVGAEVATWLALSPSLLPRPWWATAANLTAAQGVGHLAGTGGWWLARRLFGPAHPRGAGGTALRLGHAALSAATAVSLAAALRTNARQARLVAAPRTRGAASLAGGVAAGTLGYAGLLVLGELTQQGFDTTRRQLGRVLPGWAALPGALAAVAGTWFIIGDRVLARRVALRMAARAEFADRQTFGGLSRPRSPLRSGSAQSSETWASLGAAGRANVANGPDAAAITDVTGAPALEPVRVFAGLRDHPGTGPLRRAFEPAPGEVRRAARRVVAELERTGGFDRRVVVLHCSTGTGWLPDWSMEAVEFLTAGDCAQASLQYSYLSSALSYLADRRLPRAAAASLLDAVETALSRRDRPRPALFVTGESLGAYGTAGAFGSCAELLARVDGAVLSGAPAFTRLTGALTRNRDADSPWRLPVVDGGRHVRFVAAPEHLRHDWRSAGYRQRWEHPRVVIAQHASDPIVWWGPGLFVRRPRWLAEPGAAGRPAPPGQRVDVPHTVRWAPLITGWQVGVDMLNSLRVPGGHGHNYHAEFLDYWAAVLGDKASVALSDRLRARAAEWTRTHQRRGLSNLRPRHRDA